MIEAILVGHRSEIVGNTTTSPDRVDSITVFLRELIWTLNENVEHREYTLLSASATDDHLWESWAPVGRLGWPDDQARVALFLASDLSSFVTGHNVPVDGGTLAGGGWFFSPEASRFVNRPTGL